MRSARRQVRDRHPRVLGGGTVRYAAMRLINDGSIDMSYSNAD
jgi:hypothetical protein